MSVNVKAVARRVRDPAPATYDSDRILPEPTSRKASGGEPGRESTQAAPCFGAVAPRSRPRVKRPEAKESHGTAPKSGQPSVTMRLNRSSRSLCTSSSVTSSSRRSYMSSAGS